ncbi:MAG: hypothetical protein RBR86_05800 [Pseudobdellovibrionaceae bacterium]|nr:hypothetical protein [Pseudobdellovibrionaceae bacterium]
MSNPEQDLLKKSADIANREAMRYLSSQIARHLSLRFQGPPLPRLKRRGFELGKVFREAELMNSFFNAGYQDQLSRKFKSEDVSLILRVGQKFPRVRYGFAYFSLLSTGDCPDEAMHLCHLQGRIEWARTSIPPRMIQVVYDHQESTEMLAKILFHDDPNLADIIMACRYHDVAKAITGDFSKDCDITARDRRRLEKLAFELIAPEYTPSPAQHAQDIRRSYVLAFGSGAAHRDIRSKYKDCDLLERAMESAFLVSQNLPTNRAQLVAELQPFWDSAESGLQHQRAKNFFKVLEQARYRTDMKPEDYSDIVNTAEEYMRKCEMPTDSVAIGQSPGSNAKQTIVQFPARKP